MNKINLCALCLAFVLCSVVSLWAGPKEMTESQLTDISVDDTVVTPGEENGDSADAKKKALEDNASDMNMIKNPVDDPALLNQAEVLRLERQAADQRVNDQIQSTLQRVPNQ